MGGQRDLAGREEQGKNPQEFAPFEPGLVRGQGGCLATNSAPWRLPLRRCWQEQEGWHPTDRLLTTLENSLGTRELVIPHSQKEI